jgi:hypothetical protein
MGRRKRRRVNPTHEWEQVELLCAWEEQREYERIRPLVLFGEPIPDRALQIGTSERTLYRRMAAFRGEGMENLFGSPKAKRRVLPPAIRRKIVDLKAEHPPLNLEEIANICGVLFGRRPDGHTVKAVLEGSANPRKLVRRFPPYHEIPDDRERREAVVTLHGEGWSDKSIALAYVFLITVSLVYGEGGNVLSSKDVLFAAYSPGLQGSGYRPDRCLSAEDNLGRLEAQNARTMAAIERIEAPRNDYLKEISQDIR